MAFFLAIDNGGTKTDYVLADETRELARVRSGTIKRMRTDAATATTNLEGALRELTARTGVSMQSVQRTCVGTAGESVPLVTEWLREAIGTRVSGELVLVGDVEIALDAAFFGGPGILVLAGTGSNVAGRGRRGEILRAGGWGPALADQGSGHRIGLQALRALFLAIDEGRATQLQDKVPAFWGLGGLDELIAFANQVPAPDFSRLTELVLQCAKEGDAAAARVLQQEGEDLGHLVCVLLRRLGMQETEGTDLMMIAFAGSIMEKVLPVRDALMAAVWRQFPGVTALSGVVDPIAGALWRARTSS